MVQAYILRKRFEAQLLFSALLPEATTAPTAHGPQYRRGNSGRVYEDVGADTMLKTIGVTWR